MSVTNTIKPAGGGDYTTLQAWEDAVDGLSADTYIAECYEGGNLGNLAVAAWTASSVGRITVASGHGHNGSLSDGAYVDSSAANALDIDIPNFEVIGLRVLVRNTNATAGGIDYVPAGSANGVFLADGCLVHLRGNGASSKTGINVLPAVAGTTHTLTVRNNICFNTPGTGTSVCNAIVVGKHTFSGTGVAVGTASVHNNTVTSTASSTNSRGITISRFFSSGTSCSLTADVRNNLINTPTGLCFRTDFNTGTGTLTINSSNNASLDSTADWAGGTNHIEGFTATDELVTPASDVTLLEAAQCYEAGYDLSGTFTHDAFGNTRSTPWSIGAWGGVYLPDPPVAAFSGTPLSGDAPLEVTFTDASTNTPDEWLWEKNDGSGWESFSTSQNPVESFAAGTWDVRLTASNAGGEDAEEKLDYVTAEEPEPAQQASIPGCRARTRTRVI